jgi:hypothetical protein
MGNNPYYQQKCNEARVEMDTDSRLIHVADMASTLLHCHISVGSIMAAEPKTMWMIISELFNTNPTLDPCSIANLKVLSSDAIHVIRRQSLGIILSDSCQTTSCAALFSAIKESMKGVSKTKRGLSDLPHVSIYAHMNPNIVISTLNELSPKWALHRLPVQSLLDSLSKSGGNGCLALCVSIMHRHRTQLSDVFRYYSLLGRESATSLPSMDMDEMKIFLADAKIELDPVITEKLLRAACEECSPEVPVDTINYALDLISFLVFLIKVALKSDMKLEATDSATEYMVATMLTRLVQNHICSHAIRLVKYRPDHEVELLAPYCIFRNLSILEILSTITLLLRLPTSGTNALFKKFSATLRMWMIFLALLLYLKKELFHRFWHQDSASMNLWAC